MSIRFILMILCLFIISSCNSFKGSDSQNNTDVTNLTVQLKDATGKSIPAGATVWIAADEEETLGVKAQRIKPKLDINLNCETPSFEFEDAFCVNETGEITFRCRDRGRRRRKRVFITYKGLRFRLRNMTCAELAESLKEEVEVPVNTDSFVVVANTGTSDLSILDIPDHTLQSSIDIAGGSPDTMQVSPSGLYLYVMNILNNNVSVINTATQQIVKTFDVGPLPYNGLFSQDGSRYYVVNRGEIPTADPAAYTGSFMIFDTSDHSLIKDMRIGAQPSGIELSRDGQKIFVSSYKDSTISVIDSNSLEVSNVIDISSVGAGPEDLFLSEDGSKLFIAARDADTIVVIDTASESIESSFASGDGPVGLSIVGSQLYVLNLIANNMTVHNLSDYSLNTTITVGTQPYKIVSSPDNKYIYVSNFISHDLTVIDPETNTVLETVAVGQHPVGLAINPFSK